MNKKLLLIIAVVASAALTAHAQNLVQNPGFETGAFAPQWTQFGDTSFDGVGNSSPDGTPPHSGNFVAFFGAVGDTSGIMQTLTAGAGSFNVDFWLASGGNDGSSFFSASLGGNTFYTLPGGGGAFGYIHVVATVAAGANPILQFTSENNPSWWDLDDITVTAVPEPGTLGLIALGALGLVGALRKRFV